MQYNVMDYAWAYKDVIKQVSLKCSLAKSGQFLKLFASWVILHAFLPSADFFKSNFLEKLF